MSFTAGFEHIVREQEPLARYTWFRLGGAAQYFAEPTEHEELAALVQRARAEQLPVRLLGGGSNILARDAGVPGLVIHMAAPAFCDIAVAGGQVKAGGGAKLGHVISTAVREGLAGLEPLVGVPGTVGGALHGNAGSQNCDIGQWTRAATVMTHAGDIVTRTAGDLRFAYRQSSLDDLAILEATFELEPESSVEVTRRMQRQWIAKRAQQPLADASTGCIFRDALGMSAAELIEQAGLRGASVGGATLSDRNANFIIAGAGCKSSDVLALIEQIQGAVADRLGVELQTSIDIW